MSNVALRQVREDQSVSVYTEHTDRIHPRDLSMSLAANFGKNKFRVLLRKNIYIIEIDMRRHEDEDVSVIYRTKDFANAGTPKQDVLSEDAEDRGTCTVEPPTYQQRLADFKLAQKILCEAAAAVRVAG
jgi:hypothetical protein